MWGDAIIGSRSHVVSGYLCASLCFSPTHELRMMLISRLQKDMQSSNVLEVTTACIACCKLMTEDMIPAVLPIVLNLMKHDQYDIGLERKFRSLFCCGVSVVQGNCA